MLGLLLQLLFGPWFIWILLSILIYIFRGPLLSLINQFKHRRSRLRFLKEQTLNQFDANARFELGLNQLRWGNYGIAISRFQEALKIDPANVDAHFHLGIAYLRTNKFPEAVTEFNRCIELKPDYSYGQAWMRLGDTYCGQREFRTALDSYQKVLDNYPYDGEALYKMGLSHYRLKSRAEAKRYLDQSIAEIKALPRFRYKIDRVWLYKAVWLKLIANL
jgi:tetratricopeptide (TPR) repeat protein